MASGRWVNVGTVRCGRNWEGVDRRVCTARLKARRLVFGGFILGPKPPVYLSREYEILRCYGGMSRRLVETGLT